MAGERTLAGRYELVRFVGRGGMGEVWEARDRLIERRVAVKLLLHRGGDAHEAELFFREARTAGALHHPGVVTVHDLGQDPVDGTLFLVMEYVQGRDLGRRLVEDGMPPVAVAVEWAERVATALAAAHDAGVVHRDLKPSNLMLTPEGRLVVLDFGIARFVGSAHKPSKVMGTFAYMAPERFREEPGDGRSDLYALGCVLYELLTGDVPFRADGPLAVMNAHLHMPPTRPGARRQGVPPALDALVLALLAKEPRDRPDTAREVRRRLRALLAAGPAGPAPGLADLPTQTAPVPRPVADPPPPGPIDPAPSGGDGGQDDHGSTSRRRFLWIAAGAVAAVGTGGGIAAVAYRNRKQWPFHAPGVLYGGPTVVDGVVYVGSASGDNTLYALDAATCATKWTFAPGGGFAAAPAVVAGTVYAASTDGSLYALDAATGTRNWTYTAGGALHTSPFVAHGVVYVNSWDSKIHAVNAADGTGKWTHSFNGRRSAPVVAGGVVYVAGIMPGMGIRALDAADGTEKWTYRTTELATFDSAPSVVDGMVYIGDSEGHFHALDAASGSKKWDSLIDRAIFSSPVVANGVAYAYGGNNQLYAINTANGVAKWTAATVPTNDNTSSPAVADGLVYFGSGTDFYAFNAVTGAKKWSITSKDASFAVPTVAGRVVYVAGGSDRTLYALDASTGETAA
ncbi:PQQ-binding-like beta-propeller repeat protein [Streptomyces sp. XH2]|uniref:outer membrane protein assembly factor BamB family protein n=1 Tax=Streptomyces sp. XH2 TaxID=3412483 RepID=UPI003C7AD215